jgi:hypothetical protein
MIRVIDDNFLFADEWETVISKDVNDPESLLFYASNAPDGMLVTNVGDKEYAGGLLGSSRLIPSMPEIEFSAFEFSIEFRFSGDTAYQMARHELDLKVCFKSAPDSLTPIKNVANWSTQWNVDTGEIDINNATGWVGTGIKPIPFEPDVWHQYWFSGQWNAETETNSICVIGWDDVSIPIKEELQNVSWEVTNWQRDARVQIQNEMFKPGTNLVTYRNIKLTWMEINK